MIHAVYVVPRSNLSKEKCNSYTHGTANFKVWQDAVGVTVEASIHRFYGMESPITSYGDAIF